VKRGSIKTALFLARKPSPVGEELHLPLNVVYFISNIRILQPCIGWFQSPLILARVGHFTVYHFTVWSDRGSVIVFDDIGDGTGKNNGSGF
jgi:hypothetical protein